MYLPHERSLVPMTSSTTFAFETRGCEVTFGHGDLLRASGDG